MADNCPFEYRPLTEEENRVLKKIYTKNEKEYIRVGPKGYILASAFLQYAAGIREMPVRSTDTFVVSFVRSGTTWTQELVWLLANNLDYEAAKSTPLLQRYSFLERNMMLAPLTKYFEKQAEQDPEKKKVYEGFVKEGVELLADKPSPPRFIKSHLPLSLLPTGTLDTAKVVYVARDPRDVVVSCYHFFKTLTYLGVDCDFKEFYYQMIANSLIMYSPVLEHVKEAWAKRNHPNMLLLFYEDLQKDLKGVAKRVSAFLGKQYSEEQLDQLCDHLAFDNFQKNKSVDMEGHRQLGYIQGNVTTFIRKGKAGAWRESFDEEMTQHAERWVADNLRGTDLRFHT